MDYRLAPEHRFPAAVDDAYAALVWVVVNAAAMAWFWEHHYVPEAAERVHPHASPIRAMSVEGLPPAYVVIAEHDPRRDEGLAYAAALEVAGVPVTVRRYEDQMHAFFVLVNVLESADRAVAEAGAAIRDEVAAKASA